MTWVYILIVKTILAFITAFGLEIIAKFIPLNYRRIFLKYARLICFFLLFLISGLNREWRETQLVHKKYKKDDKDKTHNKDKEE